MSQHGTEQTTVKTPAESERQKQTGHEDPSDPKNVGSAKEATTVRGHDEPQSVRHSV